ncbi:hypothetical protein ETTORE_0187 [Pseudomonas phage Ettore]|nr:hypothetical protein Deiofobo_0186 [Pseudomonas phage Deifobo]WPK39896.1 hypothetical protein ETTORE_0187 [Pseudomonas phage Ettore]
MKILEFNLTEKASESIILSTIAKIIWFVIEKNAENKIYNSYKLKDLIKQEYFDKYPVLNNISDLIIRPYANEHPEQYNGAFIQRTDGKNLIALFDIGPDSYKNDITYTNTLVHELQHALDSSKGNPLLYKHTNNSDKHKEYLNQKYEINARIAELLNDLKVIFLQYWGSSKEIPSKEWFLDNIEKFAKGHQLTYLKKENPKVWKRIVSRCYELYVTLKIRAENRATKRN